MFVVLKDENKIRETSYDDNNLDQMRDMVPGLGQ